MPVLGVIFLRHAANRFEAARKQIEEDQAAGRMSKRKVLPEDYIRRRALWLPEEARYDCKFSIQKAHDNGEFFTPSSLVTMIVNVIEPDHGIVFHPACGSGGMFVQSSHFIEHEGGDTAKKGRPPRPGSAAWWRPDFSRVARPIGIRAPVHRPRSPLLAGRSGHRARVRLFSCL
jgi:hypothetical protein